MWGRFVVVHHLHLDFMGVTVVRVVELMHFVVHVDIHVLRP
jgi:hypothetical protein